MKPSKLYNKLFRLIHRAFKFNKNKKYDANSKSAYKERVENNHHEQIELKYEIQAYTKQWNSLRLFSVYVL